MNDAQPADQRPTITFKHDGTRFYAEITGTGLVIDGVNTHHNRRHRADFARLVRDLAKTLRQWGYKATAQKSKLIAPSFEVTMNRDCEVELGIPPAGHR